MNVARICQTALFALGLLVLPVTLRAQHVVGAAKPSQLHPMIPIPMPAKPPQYARYFKWLPLDKWNYSDLTLIEGRLEAGAIAKVRFGKMLFEGTVDHYREMTAGYPVRTGGVIPVKGRLTFENGDVYTGLLTRFRGSDFVFLDGEYTVKSEPTTITFYPVDFDMDGRTYRFANGDNLKVDRRYEEAGRAYEVATYRYANGAILRTNHSNGSGYEGTFDYQGPEGLSIKGRVHPHDLRPAQIWDFKDPKLGAYRLLFIVFPMGDRVDVFGVAPDLRNPARPQWLLHDQGKPPVPVRRLAPFVYALSGNCQDEPSEFLVMDDPWIYRAKADFTAGKPTGQVRSVAFNKFQTSTKFIVTGYMEDFFYDGPCERVKEGSKDTPVTLLAEKGVFKKGYLKWGGSVIELNQPDSHALYATWNQREVKRTYPSGLIYIGNTDLYFHPSGEGTVYFPDRSYLVCEKWENGAVNSRGKYYASPEAKDFTWMDFSFSWSSQKVSKPVVVYRPPPGAEVPTKAVVRGNTPCHRCEGSGSVFINCTSCYGKGYKRGVTSYNRLTNKVEGTGMVSCSTCQGNGSIRIMGCIPCDGTGRAAK